MMTEHRIRVTGSHPGITSADIFGQPAIHGPVLLRRMVIWAILLVGLCNPSLAQDYDLEAPGLQATTPISGQMTLFQDVRIFDGKTAALSPSTNVLVNGKTIERISASPITVDTRTDILTVAAGGRVLMPGLIDAHWHAFMAATPQLMLSTADPSYLHLLAARQAEATLMRGFTTVRDLGGPVFGLKRAIDEGVMTGPRIYPSGAFISQTSGHGDFRFAFEVPRTLGGPLSHSELEGVAAIADSPDEVRLRAREQLRKGASQIKLMAGGGVASPYNPIESTQYTGPEIRAAVEAADNWGTYVTVHAYTPRSIRQAVAAGVKCIEHGQLIDEPTAKLLADEGIWWSLQPFLDDEDAPPLVNPVSREKALVVFGHWARPEPVVRKNAIGLDTGCVYGGALTALVLPERRLVSVPARRAYRAKDGWPVRAGAAA